jgi:hypothetical protein
MIGHDPMNPLSARSFIRKFPLSLLITTAFILAMKALIYYSVVVAKTMAGTYVSDSVNRVAELAASPYYFQPTEFNDGHATRMLLYPGILIGTTAFFTLASALRSSADINVYRIVYGLWKWLNKSSENLAPIPKLYRPSKSIMLAVITIQLMLFGGAFLVIGRALRYVVPYLREALAQGAALPVIGMHQVVALLAILLFIFVQARKSIIA